MTKSNEILFDRMIKNFGSSADRALNYYFKHEIMKRQFLDKNEHDQLVDEISKEVLSKISVEVDVSDLLSEIDKINDALKNIGK